MNPKRRLKADSGARAFFSPQRWLEEHQRQRLTPVSQRAFGSGIREQWAVSVWVLRLNVAELEGSKTTFENRLR